MIFILAIIKQNCCVDIKPNLLIQQSTKALTLKIRKAVGAPQVNIIIASQKCFLPSFPSQPFFFFLKLKNCPIKVIKKWYETDGFISTKNAFITARGEMTLWFDEYNINDRAMIKNWPIFLILQNFTPGSIVVCLFLCHVITQVTFTTLWSLFTLGLSGLRFQLGG